MRNCRFLRLAVVALTIAAPAMTVGSAGALAQGFLNFILGGGASYPQQQHPANRPGQLTTPGGKPYQFPSSSPPSRRNDDDSGLSNYGKYRTLCVRMCDGYYFPISTSTSRKGFARDEARCQSSCGGDARLFHVPANQSTIDDAVDNDGRAYVAMKTAFLYRKKRLESCQCRQAPWSSAEMSRHLAYADAEAAEKSRQQSKPDQTKVAAATPQPEPKPSVETDRTASNDQSADDAAAKSGNTQASEPSKRPVAPPKVAATAKRVDRTLSRAANLKPPQGSGPIPVTISANTKPNTSPAFAAPMALGGSGMHWPGDPLPVQAGRKR